MKSRIEQAIEEIEIYINECSPQMLNKNNVVVNREEFEEYLNELKRHIPDEINRYRKVLANRDAILDDAQRKAAEIIEKANQQLQKIVSEQEIMKQAYAQANAVVEAATTQAQEMLAKATKEAEELRTSAVQYTDDILANVQHAIAGTLTTYQANSERLLNDLNQYYGTIIENRKELYPSEAEVIQEALEGYVEFDLEGELQGQI
mgnify:CR=1 FL=1